MKFRFIAVLLIMAFLLSGCFNSEISDKGDVVQIAVIYDSNNSQDEWKDIYNYFNQSLLINVSATALDISQKPNFTPFNLLIVHKSVISCTNSNWAKKALTTAVSDGATILLSNEFIDFFDSDFIGCQDKKKLDSYPQNLTYPEISSELTPLQEIVQDYKFLSEEFVEADYLQDQDYGYALELSTATSLINCDVGTLYSMNNYGDGTVFYVNTLLPNEFLTQGFSMTQEGSEEGSFSNTTTSANQIFYNRIAEYVSKQQFGYGVSRVFGSYGTPSMAWELHIEEINGIANNSWLTFAELSEAAGQIASFTLIRNSYIWNSKTESVTYSLNESDDGHMSFSMDYYESAYSSGTHIAADGKWLALADCSDLGDTGYFVDDVSYDRRAYPFILDYNQDGNTDLICGSSDGYIYWFEGTKYDSRLTTKEGVRICDSSGNEIHVAGYSAPLLYDINGDGFLDIISGSNDGNIYWFTGNGTLTFEPQGLLIETSLTGQSFPEIGDYDDDGADDLVIGSNEGRLLLCKGENTSEGLFISQEIDISSICDGLGDWLAPRFADLDGDVTDDLAIGVFDGYIAKLLYENGSYVFDGYIESNEQNYKGNYNLKFGSNCVPFFYDIDGDDNLDLITGSLEYGMAYPIDSEFFPYSEELQSQIDYLLNRDYYIGIHFYTNQYASNERELYEISTHLETFNKLGIDTSLIGSNQHTWYTSGDSHTQTLDNLYNTGVYWTSGFGASNSQMNLPCSDAHNVISLPFFLTDGDKKKTILVQNVSTLLNDNDNGWADISAKYEMPMCIYGHCDNIYLSDENDKMKIEDVSKFQKEYDYNFVKEDQMMLQTAAAYNLDIACEKDNGKLIIEPSYYNDNFALFDLDYQSASGVKISFAEGTDTSIISTDADVYYWSDETLYISANKTVTIDFAAEEEASGTHIEKVNIPAEISVEKEGAVIKFLDGGMMQVTISGQATTNSSGWDVSEENGKTTFTKYGSEDTIELNFYEE